MSVACRMQIRIQEVNDEEIKPVPEMKAGTEDQKKPIFLKCPFLTESIKNKLKNQLPSVFFLFLIEWD